MCGIIGVARMKDKIEQKDRAIALDLLHTGLLRGYHGTGMMYMTPKGDMTVLKQAGPPYHLVTSKGWAEFHQGLMGDNIKAIVGHHRLATTGQKTREHAHPFVKGHIAMVHNGTLEQGSTLPNFKKFDVDSEALANAIATLGIEEALSKTMGAYAIVFFDAKKKTLNMIRNYQRPLFVGFDKFNDRIAFASEKEHLEWIFKRNSVTGLDVKVEELPPNKLWTFDSKDHCFTPQEQNMFGKTYVAPSSGQSHGTYPSESSVEAEWRRQGWEKRNGEWIQVSKYRGEQETLLEHMDNDPAADFIKVLPAQHRKSVLECAAILQGIKPKKDLPALPKPASAMSSVLKPEETLPPALVKEKFAKNPKLREIYPNPLDYQDISGGFELDDNNKKRFKISIKDIIPITIVDHIEENRDKERYIIVGLSERADRLRFHIAVDGDKVVDALFSAKTVNVTVRRILLPKESAKDDDIIIWCSNPAIPTTSLNS